VPVDFFDMDEEAQLDTFLSLFVHHCSFYHRITVLCGRGGGKQLRYIPF
jgi:hypothetical protein